jgi:ADP-ribosylation factor-like protein 8
LALSADRASAAKADAVQTKSLSTATSELHALLALPALSAVPLLVLANKNDLPGAVGVDDLIREMRLGEIAGRVVSVSPRCARS